MERSVYQEDTAILNVNAPNPVTTIYVKQKLMELKEKKTHLQ